MSKSAEDLQLCWFVWRPAGLAGLFGGPAGLANLTGLFDGQSALVDGPYIGAHKTLGL